MFLYLFFIFFILYIFLFFCQYLNFFTFNFFFHLYFFFKFVFNLDGFYMFPFILLLEFLQELFTRPSQIHVVFHLISICHSCCHNKLHGVFRQILPIFNFLICFRSSVFLEFFAFLFIHSVFYFLKRPCLFLSRLSFCPWKETIVRSHLINYRGCDWKGPIRSHLFQTEQLSSHYPASSVAHAEFDEFVERNSA